MVGRAAMPTLDFSDWNAIRSHRTGAPDGCMHLDRNTWFYGPDDGPRLFRKHAVQYLMLRRLSREDRKDLLRSRPSHEFLSLLNELHTWRIQRRHRAPLHRFRYTPAMPKPHTHFVCQQCGRVSATYMGRCPQCGSFNSMLEELVREQPAAQGRAFAG